MEPSTPLPTSSELTPSPSGRESKQSAKSSAIRSVVREAESILQDVRGKAQYLIPFRMMIHLPDHDAVIRSVDTLRVTFIGTGISSTGFRKHEPCCANDPLPAFGVQR